MKDTLAITADAGTRFPTGTATYLTDDEVLAARLRVLATEVGRVVESAKGAVEIEIRAGGEDAACLLFGYSLIPEDQDRIFVVMDGIPRTITTLRVILNRWRNTWFVDLLATGIWTSYFQPVVNLAERTTVGYEALLRAKQSDGKPVSPAVALAAARETGRLGEFDRKARMTALETACGGVPNDTKLFVNLDAGSIRSDEELDEIEDAVARCGRTPSQVIFEFLESESLVQSPTVVVLRENLRQRGFLVALDDLTSGFSTLTVLDQLRPDLVKLDQRLVRGAWKDRYKSRLVKAFVDLCRDL